jgi:hypothetical protein
MADLKRLDELASIGRDFIGPQFRLTPDDLMHYLARSCRLARCPKSAAIWGRPAVVLTHSGRQLVTQLLSFHTTWTHTGSVRPSTCRDPANAPPTGTHGSREAR